MMKPSSRKTSSKPTRQAHHVVKASRPTRFDLRLALDEKKREFAAMKAQIAMLRADFAQLLYSISEPI